MIASEILTLLLVLLNSSLDVGVHHIPDEGRMMPVSPGSLSASPAYWVGRIDPLQHYDRYLYAASDRADEEGGSLTSHDILRSLGLDLISKEYTVRSLAAEARLRLPLWPEPRSLIGTGVANTHLVIILSCVPDLSARRVDIEYFPCIAKKLATLPPEEKMALSYFFTLIGGWRDNTARMRAFIALFRLVE